MFNAQAAGVGGGCDQSLLVCLLRNTAINRKVNAPASIRAEYWLFVDGEEPPGGKEEDEEGGNSLRSLRSSSGARSPRLPDLSMCTLPQARRLIPP